MSDPPKRKRDAAKPKPAPDVQRELDRLFLCEKAAKNTAVHADAVFAAAEVGTLLGALDAADADHAEQLQDFKVRVQALCELWQLKVLQSVESCALHIDASLEDVVDVGLTKKLNRMVFEGHIFAVHKELGPLKKLADPHCFTALAHRAREDPALDIATFVRSFELVCPRLVSSVALSVRPHKVLEDCPSMDDLPYVVGVLNEGANRTGWMFDGVPFFRHTTLDSLSRQLCRSKEQHSEVHLYWALAILHGFDHTLCAAPTGWNGSVLDLVLDTTAHMNSHKSRGAAPLHVHMLLDFLFQMGLRRPELTSSDVLKAFALKAWHVHENVKVTVVENFMYQDVCGRSWAVMVDCCDAETHLRVVRALKSLAQAFKNPQLLTLSTFSFPAIDLTSLTWRACLTFALKYDPLA